MVRAAVRQFAPPEYMYSTHSLSSNASPSASRRVETNSEYYYCPVLYFYRSTHPNSSCPEEFNFFDCLERSVRFVSVCVSNAVVSSRRVASCLSFSSKSNDSSTESQHSSNELQSGWPAGRPEGREVVLVTQESAAVKSTERSFHFRSAQSGRHSVAERGGAGRGLDCQLKATQLIQVKVLSLLLARVT